MVDVSDVALFDKLEDRLTAQLILTLEHSPKGEILKSFLEHFGLKEDVEDVNFDLQIQEVSSTPDAMIEGKKFLVYIESKLGEEVNPVQIENHFLGGKGKKQIFFVLCITGGLVRPKGIGIAETNLRKKGETPNFKWVNWKMLHNMFKGIEKRLDDETSTFLLKSFDSTLENLDLAGFIMFEKGEIQAGKSLVEKYNKLLEKCNILLKEVTQRLEQKGIKLIRFDRDGRSQNSCDAITLAYYFYNKRTWKHAKNEWEDGSLAYYGFQFDEGTIRQGIMVNGKLIYKKEAKWRGLLESMPTPTPSIGYWIRGKRENEETESIEAFLEKLTETELDETITNVDIFWTDDLTETLEQDLPNTIAKRITVFLSALEKYNLYLSKKYRKRRKSK